MPKCLYPAFMLLLLLPGCQKAEKTTQAPESVSPAPAPLFVARSADRTHLDFTNRVIPNDSLNILDFNYFYNGGGVAVGDVNNDSLPDVYFTGNMTSSRLYVNRGNFTFEDVTGKAGVGTEYWATGASMADVNGDGWLDMYVCFSAYRTPGRRVNKLFINNQDGTFTDRARQYGLAFDGYSTQAAFLDYDRDGDPDLYLATVYQDRTNPNIPRPKRTDDAAPGADKLFRNEGNGRFTDVSKGAGIRGEGYGLGVVVTDINQDNWPDLYVTNDFVYDDHLWVNNRNGTFTDRAKQYFRHTSRFAMGTDAADVNHDGLVDLFSLDMLPDDNRRQKLMNMGMNYDLFNLSLERGYLPQYSRNTLQLNNGDGSFSEIGYLAGVYKTDWSWSALLADFDNDGHRDLFITNGIPKDITDSDFIMYRDAQVQAPGFNYAETKKTIFRLVDQLPEVKKHDFIFRNNGDLTFSDQSTAWGFSEPAFSNGAAYADLDRDGDLDLVINRINQAAGVYQNQASQQLKHHYLSVRLTGYPVPEAKVAVWAGGQGQVAESGTVRGFQSAVENSLHFGLGKAVAADSLTVTWPDGKKQTLTQIPADRTLVLDYRQALRPKTTRAVAHAPLFEEVTGQHGIQYAHRENAFVDFKMEPLLPHQFSRNGPGIAVADVNGDGLDDFCVGGAARTPGKVFIQTPSGKFTAKDLPDPDFEDMGLLLFDADGDRDADLYVVSGGSEFNAGSAPYQDRLYVNDGKGNFARNAAALPVIRSSGSCVTAADYDRDADLDLFVGGRVLPGRYPLPAQSYLLRNDGGRFVDVTATVAPGLGQIGLVTAALWTDYDGNGQADLMLAGEWMPPTLFRNENGRFVNVTARTGLAAATGWWNSLAGDDFDGDGDTDYVAGNLGLNTPYPARPGQPVAVHAADFDGNGTFDPVLSYFMGGLSVPVATRDALAVQVPLMRRRFPKYSDYAAASLEQVLTPSEKQNAYQVKSEYHPSSYLENKGNGLFAVRPLPVEAQFAPVFGLLTGDYDHDGHTDVLLSGNSFAPEYVAGRYDAGSGLYLRGDGKGNFTAVPALQSGYRVTGDAKGMAALFTASGQELICTGRNNGVLAAHLGKSGQTQPVIDVLPMDAWAEITRADGRKTRKELYHGSGYLGQSSRRLRLPGDASTVRIYDTSGKAREVALGQLSGRTQ